MGNVILNSGVTTPFVLFNFATGSIEATIKPKYFVSLSHNRTCKQACTFKLTVMYVPDTFKEGTPTVIDNMLVTSRNERVTYQYGYYDWRGVRYVQYRTYVGQLNKYDSTVDVASGTITYTIEGNAVAVDLLNIQTSLDNTQHNKYGWTPAKVLKICSQPDFESRPFYQLGLNYERVISETDKFVELPNYNQQGMMDIILGSAKGATNADNTEKQTNIDKDGGIVQHSRVKIYSTVWDAWRAGEISNEEFASNYIIEPNGIEDSSSATDEEKDKASKYTQLRQNAEAKLYSYFMAYFDDGAGMTHKYGTFYYVPKEGNKASNTFVYEYGNNVRQSDVLSVSFTYDGSVALANSTSSSGISASIDGTGQNIGQTNATTNVLALGRNTYPTLSGFNENRFLSQRELISYMIYPSKATLQIMGQIEPSNLLEVVDLIILINGTKHPTLSGEYTILSVVDDVSNSGFTTTLELVRKEDVSKVKLETYVTNPKNGKASTTSKTISEASASTTNAS